MNDDPTDLDLDLGPSEVGDPQDVRLPDLGRAQGPGPGLWALVVLGLTLVLGGAFWFLRPRPATESPAPTPAPSVGPSAASTPPPLLLPPLEGSDATVRDLTKALSAHPLFALWLGQKELIRTLAALVLNVAEGESPRAHLPFLAPRSGFAVIERRSGRLLLDPMSYARYDPVADAAESLDPESCARAYRVLEPLFESAYRELGHPEGGFSKALHAALGKLLAVPVVEGEIPLVRVEKAVVLYEFFDERLEALSIPQKHLLRMGPRNVARIQTRLRGLAQALGEPGQPKAPPVPAAAHP